MQSSLFFHYYSTVHNKNPTLTMCEEKTVLFLTQLGSVTSVINITVPRSKMKISESEILYNIISFTALPSNTVQFT